MRDIIPYIFWPWLLISCTVLVRRRIGGGSWKSQLEDEVPPPIEFSPPPIPPEPVFTTEPAAAEPQPDAFVTESVVAAPALPVPGSRARSLAEALEGITMPCDLAPLMGSGPLDSRQVAFFTNGHDAETVGSALSDELERLGYAITPDDNRSIRAERGDDLVRAKMASATLDSEAVMTELHPSAPEGSLVLELKLT